MDALQMMRVFARVAQRASFAAAAEELRMSRASVTKHVAAIEERHGVRLLDRTTRSVSMTEAGRVYLDRCLECLQAFDDSEAAIGELSAEPKGVLRIAGPFDFDRHLHELITKFMKAHPAIELDVRLSNRTLDMVDEGIDVYLRIPDTLDADSIARPLAITTMGLFGTRAYFRKHGRPRTLADLAHHRFANFNEPPVHDEWTVERRGKRTEVRFPSASVSNSGAVAGAGVCRGVAMGVLPSILLPPDHAKLIERVLPEWSLGHRGVYAVYPHRRFVSSKVRAFVEFARAAFGGGGHDPWSRHP